MDIATENASRIQLHRAKLMKEDQDRMYFRNPSVTSEPLIQFSDKSSKKEKLANELANCCALIN